MRKLHWNKLKVAAAFHDQALQDDDVPKPGEFVIFEGQERKVKQLEARATQPGWFTVEVHFESMPSITENSTIQPHQQRVLDEHRELSDKTDKLIKFFNVPMFEKLDVAEQDRLKLQWYFMHGYKKCLEMRLKAMGLTPLA